MSEPERPAETPGSRREFVSRAAMAAGLAGGYGAFGLVAGRFLYPARPDEAAWQFVVEQDRLREGETLRYRAPSGETVNLTRRGRDGGAEDFIALSSTCPHLGCQVHWEAQNNRYFCPCHNGTFDPTGKATGGPPADAGQSLLQYPVRVEKGLVYLLVRTERLVRGEPGRVVDVAAEPRGPGHDPCLSCLGRRGPPRSA